MGVRPERQADLGMAQDLHDDPGGYPLKQRQSGGGMARIVQAGVSDACGT